MQLKCIDCGNIFNNTLKACPECGCPKSHCLEYHVPDVHNEVGTKNESINTVTVSENTTKPIESARKDWANFIYECGVLYWETLTKRFADFQGRASRTEFWSFTIISLIFGLTTGIGILIVAVPTIAVSIRRMHDINKCGWWSICPIACLFLFLKRSDFGNNRYGSPANYNHIFS